MRIAAFDLGTNTFNLLVADATDTFYHEVYRDKKAVKLGHAGITRKVINDEAIERGVEAIRSCMKAIEPLNVDKILAVATSAIRSAENGVAFTKRLYKEFKLEVHIIGGDEEAELIYLGIRRAVPLTVENVLMLDIGGGSNEFIIANSSIISWKQSFPLGIARLLEIFKPSDPMTNKVVCDVMKYLDQELKPLKEAVAIYSFSRLIGSSGSFDTLANMCNIKNNQGTLYPSGTFYKFNKADILAFCDKLIYSTLEEREKMKGMDLMRIEMIPLAAVFIKYVLEIINVNEIYQSSYAIKEGIIFSYSEVEN